MKNLFAAALALCLLLACLLPSALAEGEPLNMFTAEDALLQSLTVDAFSADPADAPSDEELTRMLQFAMHAASAHTLTPAHFVVIRDAEEQRLIASGLAAFGLGNPASEGTVLVLVFADTLRDQQVHEAAYNGWYAQTYYGIYDAGGASAYLALAAQSLGYGVHQIAGLNIPRAETGEVAPLTTGGNFSLVTGENWDASKYLTSKDGAVDFTHTIANATMPPQSMDVKADGNLTLLAAVVIGKRAEGLDAASGATMAYPGDLANFNFWDPQDGVSYGKSVPAGEAVSAGMTDIDLTGVADGVYEGSAASTSSAYTVRVTVEGGAIAKLEIVSGQESMRMTAEDTQTYLGRIVDAQSILVDGVTGATEDSSGIVSAILAALGK